MVYEYQCPTCKKVREVRDGIIDAKYLLLYCKECDRMKRMNRIISRSSFILKGNGWAKDGYVGEKA